MKATLVFLAAGFGSRFSGGIKQLEPVGPNGEVLMDYAVHDALRAGFERVVFIIRRDLEEAFRGGVGGRVEKKCDVEYVFQDLNDLPAGYAVPAGRTKPWGTAQALLACRNVVKEPFCVLNADDYYGPRAFEQIYTYLKAMPADGRLDGCMAGYVLGNTVSENGAVTRGVCRVDERGRLLAIHETRGIQMLDGKIVSVNGDDMQLLDGSMPVSMNIWGLPPAFIDFLQGSFPRFMEHPDTDVLRSEFLIPTAIENMLLSGRGSIQVLETTDRWFGMTYALDKEKTRARILELVNSGVYPKTM